jgi:hypothetical protein
MNTPIYGDSDSKITKEEWETLNHFFQSIEPPAQNELFASGDHYWLYRMLLDFGFRPPSDAMEIYRMAEEILLLGYEDAD